MFPIVSQVARPSLLALVDRCITPLLAERDRWPLWLPVFLGAGVSLYFALAIEPPLWSGMAAATISLIVLLATRRVPVIYVTSIILFAAAVGFASAQIRTQLVSAPVLREEIYVNGLEGRIREVELRPRGQRILLDRIRIDALPADKLPAFVRVTVTSERTVLMPGQVIRLKALLGPPPPPSMPGAYDFQREAFFWRLGAVGFAFGSPEVLQTAVQDKGLLHAASKALASLRLTIALRIRAVLPEDTAAVAAALIMGEQAAIPDSVLDDMRDSGLAHLLSISGLHILLVTGIVFFGLRAALALIPRLALDFPIKKWCAGAALVIALCYVLLAGAPVPTLRAYVMTGLMLLAVLLDRTAISMRLVAWAATIVLLVQPEALLGASFQMSFAAVVALVAAYEWIRDRPGVPNGRGALTRRIFLYLGGVILSSAIATVATAPYAVFHFNRFAGFGVVANILAVPLTGLWIMPWAILTVILMPLGLEAWALLPMGWGIDAVIWIAAVVADWPGAAIMIPAAPAVSLAAVTLGGLWLCLWRGRWRWPGAIGPAIGALLLFFARMPDVVVSADGRLVAVAGDDGRLVVSSDEETRERETWLRRAGDETAEPWPEQGFGAGGRLACDSLGCIYKAKGTTIAIAHQPLALVEDCSIADVLISMSPVRRKCPSAEIVIDRFDLWREGGHAIWIRSDGEITVRSVNDSRGERPWAIGPDRD